MAEEETDDSGLEEMGQEAAIRNLMTSEGWGYLVEEWRSFLQVLHNKIMDTQTPLDKKPEYTQRDLLCMKYDFIDDFLHTPTGMLIGLQTVEGDELDELDPYEDIRMRQKLDK